MEWRESSFSSTNGGDCVEIATAAIPCIAIRDSKTPGGEIPTVSRSRFAEFIDSALRSSMELVNARWRKSSYSSTNGGECVEVADRTPCVAIRDSKTPAEPSSPFPASASRTSSIHSPRN
ncbi:DUF397 domain-containing protein [Streptomyces sp. L7]